MSYGCAFSPGELSIHMGPTDPATTVSVPCLSGDIGPQGGPTSPESLGTFDLSHAQHVTASWSGGGYIPLYNGFVGVNPRGPTYNLTFTPSGGQPSGYALFTSNQDAIYGYSVVRIDFLPTSIVGLNVLEQFDGVLNQSLATKLPDVQPVVPGGQVAGWKGRAAYGNVFQHDTGGVMVLATGGNDGQTGYARVYTGQSDLIFVEADILRKNYPGGVGELFGIIIRSNGVDGNTDAGTEGILLYCTRNDNNSVFVSWGVFNNGMSNPIQQGYLFTTIAWAYGLKRKLRATVKGSTLKLYVADAVTGANAQLLLTVTLTPTTFNDSTHVYGGLVSSHFTDCLEFSYWACGPLVTAMITPGRTIPHMAIVQGGPSTLLYCLVLDTAVAKDIPLTQLSVTVQYQQGSGWLEAVLEGTNGPTQLDLTYNAAGMAPGRYNATVTILGTALNVPFILPVVLEVKAPDVTFGTAKVTIGPKEPSAII